MNTVTVSDIIRRQIGQGVLMSLGARAFVAYEAGLAFDATILPMTKSGKRATAARTMRVYVKLNAADYYDISVTYPRRGDRYGIHAPEVHYEAADVDALQLSGLLLALDYDGETVLNPRYI